MVVRGLPVENRVISPGAPGDDAGMNPTPDGYRLLSVDESRLPEYQRMAEAVFGEHDDEETLALLPFAVPLDRTRAVESVADGELAAVHGSYPFRMTLPGGSAPCAGLTWVGTRPDHRRRGLLTAMVRDHVDRSLARGEVLSALFAAEPAIYQRYGYGSAAWSVQLAVPRGARLHDVPGSADLTVRFEPVNPARHQDLTVDLQRRAHRHRPGWVDRPNEALRSRLLVDPPAWRQGGEPIKLVTVRDPGAGGEVRAFAVVSRQKKWDDGGNPDYTVQVTRHAALDPAAAHRLWTFLLDLGLSSTVRVTDLAPDDPLLHLLVDLRRARPTSIDNLWLRILDVPAALAARRYAAPVDVVLGVRDALLPANQGAWRLTAAQPSDDDRGGRPAEVTATDREPDLVLDVRELGAVLLGGPRLSALAAAGRVQVSAPARLQQITAALGWTTAPLCPWSF